MAKLVTTKEKYGVSVAARIDPNLAHQISDKAERLGVSFAQMISMLISKGFNPSEPVSLQDDPRIGSLEEQIDDLEWQLERHKDCYKQTAAEFIRQVSDDNQNMIEYSDVYNSILTEKKASSEL